MSDILTDAELAEIEKRAEAATVEPWTVFAKGETIEVDYDGDTDAPIIKWTGFDGSYLSRKHDRANANFIAASRTDIPALLATIRSDRKEIARLRTALKLISFVGPAKVEAGGVLWLRQDVIDAHLIEAGFVVHRPLTGESETAYFQRLGKVSEPDACHEEERK
jgi:hypothetical protein